MVGAAVCTYVCVHEIQFVHETVIPLSSNKYWLSVVRVLFKHYDLCNNFGEFSIDGRLDH